MKKVTLITLTFLLLTACSWQKETKINAAAGGNTSVSSTVSFLDISGHWARVSIEQAIQKGYVDGYQDGTFKPEQKVTRAEFVKLVVTALKLPVSPSSIGPWYLPYTTAADQAGIHAISDFPSGDWNTAITRLEMARIALRAAGKMTDEEKKWMYLATKAGIITGFPGGVLGEDEATTRAQSVTVIERILTVKGGGILEADKYAVSTAEIAWHKTNIFTVMPEFFCGKVIKAWDPNSLFVETPDGNYRGEVDSIVAIDLSDPNDPNIGQLPDIQTLQWYNLAGKGYPVANYKDSYIIWFKGSRTVFNKDTSVYGSAAKTLPVSMGGITKPDLKAFMNGNLNSSAFVYIDSFGDFPAVIVPKHNLKTMGSIFFTTYAPAIPPHSDYNKFLLEVSIDREIK